MDVHPLQHQWSFYLHYPTFSLDTRKYSREAYQRLGAFSAVEDFWRYWTHLPLPSDVFTAKQPDGGRKARPKVNGRDLEAIGLFKTGPKPEWEDPLNLKGGHWEVRQDFNLARLDGLWYDLASALVGETLEDGRDIMGARVVDKSKSRATEYRLEVWVSTADKATAEAVRTRLGRVLGGGQDLAWQWKDHGESLNTALWCNAKQLGISQH
jgi:translation initiation factor 4E